MVKLSNEGANLVPRACDPPVKYRRVAGSGDEIAKARETSRRFRGMFLGEILRSRVPEMPFPAFWGVSLQHSEDYKTSYKIHKRHFRTLNIY